jgi:glycosyltransferase involved in cell wall biosynthesis
LAGRGSDQFIKYLQNIILDNNLEKKVEFLYDLEPDEVVSFLKAAKVLILARPSSSQADYGFPTKIGEYLASEVITIVTRTGDIGKFLKNKINALVIEPNNLDLLIEAIDWSLSNYDESKNIAKRGAQTASLSFNNKIESKKLIDFINTIN